MQDLLVCEALLSQPRDIALADGGRIVRDRMSVLQKSHSLTVEVSLPKIFHNLRNEFWVTCLSTESLSVPA